MKATPKLQEFVVKVATQHGVDLQQTGAYLRLDLAEERLIIENIGAYRISLSCQLFLYHDWVADPEIVLWIDGQGAWTPIEVTQVKGGWHSYAEVDPNGDLEVIFDPNGQAVLADFAEDEVMPNLLKQGWLDQAGSLSRNGQPTPKKNCWRAGMSSSTPGCRRRIRMTSPSDFMDQFVYDLMARYEAVVQPSRLLYLELRMKGHGVLIVEEKIKRRQMRVCYLLFDSEGNPVREPDLWFYIDPYGYWVPYEMHRHTAGNHAFADLDLVSGELTVIDAKNQVALACFADFWAEILRAQGWLEFAYKVSYASETESEVEDDSSQPPDVVTLWDWVDEYGKCTATDGCWVSPDGVCEHGYKSWLLEMGLI